MMDVPHFTFVLQHNYSAYNLYRFSMIDMRPKTLHLSRAVVCE